ncbi:hypothetical protein ACWPLX_000503 [Escherichia coli]|nr:hypothetical protein [Escherichia coli]HBE5449685.1 hypothetical protein [Escherichia coli]
MMKKRPINDSAANKNKIISLIFIFSYKLSMLIHLTKELSERCAAAKIVPCCGFLTKLPDSTKSAESYNTCLGQ